MDEASKLFREGMSRLSAAVNIVTSDGPEGRHGMTASAVCSVTDDPPTLLVCVNRQNRSHDRFNANGTLCVNVLGEAHQEIAGTFAGPGNDDRFSKGDWTTHTTGAPILKDAVVAFDCQIVERREIGSHSVFYARVKATHLGGSPAQTLVWFNRRFYPLTADVKPDAA